MQVYKDDNHKPEMAIAISDFEALCSFVPHSELVAALHSVPELRECVGEVAADGLCSALPGDKAALQTAFTALMTCDSNKVRFKRQKAERSE